MQYYALLRPVDAVVGGCEGDVVADIGRRTRVVHEVRVATFHDAGVVHMVGGWIFEYDAALVPLSAVGRFGELNAIVAVLALAAEPHAVEAVFDEDIWGVHVSFAVGGGLGVAGGSNDDCYLGRIGASAKTLAHATR